MLNFVLLIPYHAFILHGFHNEHDNRVIFHKPRNGSFRPSLHPSLQFKLLPHIKLPRQTAAKFISSTTILYIHMSIHLNGVSKIERK